MSKRIKKRESWKITPWYPVGYYLDIWSGFILEQDNGMWLGGLNILPSIVSIPRFELDFWNIKVHLALWKLAIIWPPHESEKMLHSSVILRCHK